MKLSLTIAALLLALAPFAQAQGTSPTLTAHPDARNDRPAESTAISGKHHVGEKAVKHGKARHHRRHHASKTAK